MSDVRRAEHAARDLSNVRTELNHWIRRAREAEEAILSGNERHVVELAARDREIARLKAELRKLKLEATGPLTRKSRHAA